MMEFDVKSIQDAITKFSQLIKDFAKMLKDFIDSWHKEVKFDK